MPVMRSSAVSGGAEGDQRASPAAAWVLPLGTAPTLPRNHGRPLSRVMIRRQYSSPPTESLNRSTFGRKRVRVVRQINVAAINFNKIVLGKAHPAKNFERALKTISICSAMS
jgi:hypothetical protein